jgi:plastocyanin
MSTSHLPRWCALACAAALALGGLAACGDDDDGNGGGSTGGGGGGGGGGVTISEQAVESGGLAFSEPSLSAQAGSVTITLDNPSGNQLPHAIEVEGNGIEEETETIQPGDSASVTVDLEPGTYEFYCPVDGHRGQGMEGTLTVE